MHPLLSIVTNVCVWASEAMRPHLSQITIAISATLLAIFGGAINSAVKRSVSKWPLVVRVLVFVLLVAFGYGAANIFASHLLARMLMQLDSRYLAVVIIVSFVLIGILAEHKGHV
jgi:hypothetical protein